MWRDRQIAWKECDFYVCNWLMFEDIIIKQGREKSKTEKL